MVSCAVSASRAINVHDRLGESLRHFCGKLWHRSDAAQR
jgi:hypothetical protein